MLSQMKHRFVKSVSQLVSPIGPDTLRLALKRVTGGGAELLFVHSSLSACGWFRAGPQDVLCALREISDTLVLPTHSYCYPECAGEIGPLFDPNGTPSQNGLLTETFRKRPGVIRSIHATHSLAASGSQASEICASHYLCETPCGAGTPYSRLIQKRASVLLFAVSFRAYTLFHTAEDASGSKFAYECGDLVCLRVLDEQGKQRNCFSKRQFRDADRFEEFGAVLEDAGLVRRMRLGRGLLLYVPDCSKVHEFTVDRLRKFPDYLRPYSKTPLDVR